MAVPIVSTSELTRDCDVKEEPLKTSSTLDKLILNVLPKSVVSNVSSDDSSEHSSSTTYVTIHLPDGMQGSTLSQQKLQELILHLSQSGQIQLREDSKIVIDVSTLFFMIY